MKLSLWDNEFFFFFNFDDQNNRILKESSRGRNELKKQNKTQKQGINNSCYDQDVTYEHMMLHCQHNV